MHHYVDDSLTIRFFEGQEASAVEREPFTYTLVDDPAPDLAHAVRAFRDARITVVAEADDASFIGLVVSTPHFEEANDTGELLMSGNTLVIREMHLQTASDLDEVGPRLLAAVVEGAHETGYHQVIAEISDSLAGLFAAAGWTVPDGNVGRAWLEQPGIVIVEEGSPYPMVGLGKSPQSGKRIAYRVLNDELIAGVFEIDDDQEENAINTLINAAESHEKVPAWFAEELDGWAPPRLVGTLHGRESAR
ncbi:hypothetical protein [Microbacterium panaciterrae]